MEVNNNLHNSPCSTQNRGRPRNYLFVCVSSASFKYILVVVGRLKVYKVEQNRTAQEKGERHGREGSGRKECCSIWY